MFVPLIKLQTCGQKGRKKGWVSWYYVFSAQHSIVSGNRLLISDVYLSWVHSLLWGLLTKTQSYKYTQQYCISHLSCPKNLLSASVEFCFFYWSNLNLTMQFLTGILFFIIIYCPFLGIQNDALWNTLCTLSIYYLVLNPQGYHFLLPSLYTVKSW